MSKQFITRSTLALAIGLLLTGGITSAARLEWRFNDTATPAMPEIVTGLVEAGRAIVTPGAFGSGWQARIPGFGTADGCWDLGRRGTIRLAVPASLAPSGVRQVRVKVTQWVDGKIYGDFATVSVRGATRGLSLASPISSGPVGGWVEDLSVWEFTEGAKPGEITITSRDDGSIIDRVVVESGSEAVSPALLGIRAAGTLVELSWPASLEGFVLEQNINMGRAGDWEPVTGTTTAADGRLSLTTETGAGTRFYRLRRP